MPFIIHRKPPYRVYVEEGPGGAMAHVAELPGCFAVGSDAARAVGAVPRAIAGFLDWLRAHREPLVPEAHVPRPSVADLFVSEVRSEGAPVQAGSRAALFEYDRAAWDDDKVERTLRWLGYSRADLLARVEGLDDAALKAAYVQPDRTLWDTLWHVANAEYGYVNRIAGPLGGLEPITDTEPSDVRERLAVVRELFERHVRAIPPEKRSEVIYPTWAARPDEPSTLPKALRRALEHELEHLGEIR
jgi:uncharacterized damage-inducible protein DinB/predicted RNase H-like HicB family nuclease